jgi:hypothetical protein
MTDPQSLYRQQEMNYRLPSGTLPNLERNNHYVTSQYHDGKDDNDLKRGEGGAEQTPSFIPFNIPTRLNNTLASSTLLRPQKPSDLLPEDYEPTPLDVCSGRGKRNWNHSGNVAFRDLIQHTTPAYMQAKSKNDKTAIVCNIVEEMRALGCQFLKQHNATGRWYDIGDAQARDKVGHSLRDQVTAYNRSIHQPPTLLGGLHSPGRTHTRRPSVALSDSGNEAELRRMSLDTTALFGEFARRPSWIAGENEMEVVTLEDDDVPSDMLHMAGGATPGGNARRMSSYVFLDTFDYYIENDMDLPLTQSNGSNSDVPPAAVVSTMVLPFSSTTSTPAVSPRTNGMDARQSLTVADLQAHTVNHMMQDSVQSWDPRSSQHMSSIVTVRRSAMSGGTTLRRLTNSFSRPDRSVLEMLDGMDFSEDSDIFLDHAGITGV